MTRQIDLRSDTVTRPTPAMRQAMADAEVGDDVFGEDPTVLALEREVANLTGKEAALFVASGTMGNQLAIACQTRRGDEVMVGEGAHVMFSELGAGAALNGVQFVVAGTGGFFTGEDVLASSRSESLLSQRTALVAVENSHNRAGGRVLDAAKCLAVTTAARSLGLACHLDGARVWNASVATGESVESLVSPFDTASVCFSKGLGAPVGSALAGPCDLLHRARRIRKMWGGGMRQSGILAAAALHALSHHRARLSLDHEHAKLFAAEIARRGRAAVDLASIVTNIVHVDLGEPTLAEDVVRGARERGVLLAATGPRRLRVVTHLDVSRDDVVRAGEVLSRVVEELTP